MVTRLTLYTPRKIPADTKGQASVQDLLVTFILKNSFGREYRKCSQAMAGNKQLANTLL